MTNQNSIHPYMTLGEWVKLNQARIEPLLNESREAVTCYTDEEIEYAADWATYIDDYKADWVSYHFTFEEAEFADYLFSEFVDGINFISEYSYFDMQEFFKSFYE